MADEWDNPTESGLLSNYEGIVLDAHFGVDPVYNQGNTMFLQWSMQTDVEEHPETNERWNLPPDWKTYDGGNTVEYWPPGASEAKAKRFNVNSQVGQLFERVVGFPEAVELLRSRGTIRDARVWNGTKWFMEEVRKPYSFKDRETGEVRTGESVRNYPGKFIGVVDLALLDANGVVSGQQDQPALLSPADEVVLGALAKSKPHGEFVEAVMEYDGGRLCANNDLIASLADEGGLYARLRSGG